MSQPAMRPGPSLAPPDVKGAPRSRRAAALELAGLVAGIEFIMWVVPLTPNPRAAYAGAALLLAAFLLLCHVRDHVGASRLGFRVDNFFSVLKRVSPPLVGFVLLVVCVGAAAGTLRFRGRFFSMLIFVPPWALLQQYMLLAFAHRRWRVIVGPGRGPCVATAALFALLHLPNPALMAACAFGGYVWAREYEREPNLYATALTHAVASAFLANSLPGWLLKNMVVGYNYFFR